MRLVVTAAEMRALDAATIQEIGLPGVVLMENAGRGVVAYLLDEGAVRPGARVAVVCGGGNNGGDGYVIARVLREVGVDATVYLAVARETVRGDALLHLGVYEQVGGVVCPIASAVELAGARDAVGDADVIVDALFGTGLTRPVTGHMAAVIDVVNRGRGRRVAVDVPSGLDADSGQILGVAVAADATATIAFYKVGVATAPGCARAGVVRVIEIGIPRLLAQAEAVRCGLLEAADVAALVPRASLLDHKGARGHVLVVAGAPGTRGAGRLAAWAALRGGAGLVTLASSWRGGEPVAPDAIMTAELDGEADGAAARLGALVAGKRALAIGPGMARGVGGRVLVAAALAQRDAPLVIDADGLNQLTLDEVAQAAAPAVLTPHPGEAARLLGCSTAEVEADRMAAVRALAERSRAVVLLKGARTLVCDGSVGDGFVTINPTGGPALATAGSGDVLTGAIAALLAQGVAPAEAARLGAWIHGVAGERAAARHGERGVVSSDLADELGPALAALSTPTR